jgi:hypothetical protein
MVVGSIPIFFECKNKKMPQLDFLNWFLIILFLIVFLMPLTLSVIKFFYYNCKKIEQLKNFFFFSKNSIDFYSFPKQLVYLSLFRTFLEKKKVFFNTILNLVIVNDTLSNTLEKTFRK